MYNLSHKHTHILYVHNIYIYIYIYVCVCVCVLYVLAISFYESNVFNLSSFFVVVLHSFAFISFCLPTSFSQLHVVDSTMLVKDPVGEVQKVEKFLGIRPVLTEHNFHLDKQKGFYCRRPFYTQDIICLGKGKGMPHPSLPPEVKQPLYEFYRKHNERLFQVIGKRFDWLPK